MRELLSDPNALVGFVVGAVVLVIACLILAVSWRDSARAIREFFGPLKYFRRPRFRLRTLLLFTTALAIMLKLGTYLNWLPQCPWLEAVLLFGIAVLAVCPVLILIQSFLWTFERRPRVEGEWRMNVDEDASADESPAESKGQREKGAGHLRFRVRKRPVLPFKW